MTWIRPVVGAVVGVAVGYAMHRFVGCKTGACPLTANPYTSMIVYGLLGLMMGGMR